MEFVVNNFKTIFVMAHKNLLKTGNANEIFGNEALLKESMLKKLYISHILSELDIQEKVLPLEEFVRYIAGQV